MKIKHWQGYGSVNAVKTSRIADKGIVTLKIHVSGNHECGLERTDAYDVANWLVKKFDKTFQNYRNIISISTESGYDMHEDMDTCDYTICYRETGLA